MTSLLAAPSAAPLLGAQRPRVSSCPPYVSTAGPEAVDLAASAGLFLDPWQQWILHESLGEREDGRWSAFEVGLCVPRQNGKGSIIEARELFALVLGDEELVLHSSHLFKTSAEAFRRVLALISDTPDLARRVAKVSHTHGAEGIELTNGHRLHFVARSKGGGRGMSADLVILDEAFALTSDQMEALLPVMSARDNGQLWYTSSPPLDAVTGEVMFGIKARGEAGDPGLFWADWGQLPGVDLDDRAVWAAANPAKEIRIFEETIARERRAMTPEGFGRERLGIWPETAGTAVISPELWAGLAVQAGARPADVVFAIDVAPDRQSSAICAAGALPDGRVLLSVVDHRPGTDWIPDRMAMLAERWQPWVVALDGKSPAATLIPALAEQGIAVPSTVDRPLRGDLAVLSTADAAIAWGLFVDGARQQRVAHLDEVPLNVALAGAKTRPLGDGSAWARRGGTDITPLVAATQAYWALVLVRDRVSVEIEPEAYWL